jgi:cytochrome P450
MRQNPPIVQPSRVVPGPRGYPLIGILPQLRTKPLQVLLAATTQHPEASIVRLGGQRWGLRWFLVSRPEAIKVILQDQNRLFHQGFKTDSILLLLGNSLPMLEADRWRQRRRLMQPAFHREVISNFTTAIGEILTVGLRHWQAFAQEGRTCDIEQEMTHLSLAIAIKTLFGLDIDATVQTAITAFHIVQAHVQLSAALPLPLWLPTRRNKMYKAAIQTLNQFVGDIIRTRRQQSSAGTDLLGLLLSAQDSETGERMTELQVRDEVMSLLFAGHETTTSALTWTWYLLSQHPAVEDRVRTEVRHVLAGSTTPTAADVPQLTYTQMVLEEVMRLYPPAWLFARTALEEITIDGYLIPAGAILLFSPYVTHRHPVYWDDPETFNPKRFTPERVKARPRFTYIPFSGGPRQCIGNTFAMHEAIITIATIIQVFHLELAADSPIEAQAQVALHTRNGLPMKFVKAAPPPHERQVGSLPPKIGQ